MDLSSQLATIKIRKKGNSTIENSKKRQSKKRNIDINNKPNARINIYIDRDFTLIDRRLL